MILEKIKADEQLSSFQKSVYQACYLIPRGQVSTYQEIAKFIGNPRAARAVGNALNKNPFAPEIPCHRVVGANGRLGGFAGGLEKKIKLLNKEGLVCRAGYISNYSDKFFSLS